ncbi:hypothetical protein C683_0955 [Catellicoccus marimammalium M35/04/3]|uniref:Transposase n=1 Tax=Catellicoccus marimammalium M35/04/3 TaxID=1234409 RepID=K8ZAX2_9ENTE|nr:hypothetical protein C683_0955 [Catellicoccus marimammalium M35/04/3]
MKIKEKTHWRYCSYPQWIVDNLLLFLCFYLKKELRETLDKVQ